MALMFPRLARNYVKNGYFPTDELTLTRICFAIAPFTANGTARIFDPCAGEGAALYFCKSHIQQNQTVVSYGIEYDVERATHAKTIIDRCIKGSLFDCVVGQRSMSLLFLNPPYGDKVSDKAGTGEIKKGKQRLETDFLKSSLHTLQFGGLLVLIVPYYVLRDELAQTVAGYFDNVSVYMAPEQQFKQAVVFGIRKRVGDNSAQVKSIRTMLEKVAEGELPVELPEDSWETPYTIPPSIVSDVRFKASNIDPQQLSDEIKRSPCLWSQFPLHFDSTQIVHRRPLRPLSPWHLALALAAGQVSGIVKSTNDNRVYVIKGDTYKEKKVTTEIEMDEDRIIETRVATDQFVPTIRAIDFTENSPRFGETIIIR